MSYDDYELLRIDLKDRVATATVDAPPINVMTLALFGEIARFGQQVGEDDDVRVVVLESANPDFFIAHFDVAAILEFPIDSEAQRSPGNPFHQMCERFRTMPKVTIAQIEGRVGGGGCELIQAFDMRFGVVGKTRINQMEVPIGILPGGGGTQRLPRLVGRGRALEIILGGEDLDAETAERWGLLNRALTADAIGTFVEALAHRIASFPAAALELAKQSVNAAELPLAEGLVEEAYLFQRLLRTEDAQRNMRRFLELGGQTREGELEVADLSSRANREDPEA
ncbi:MAG: enoyl-CoA hydratase/isomerase family protein [Myxococcota bacterium]|nr:enoyl-CoA hydratase/isomerase family protein [Myxococcota bacterium]